MGQTITARYPFSGKNALYVVADEATLATGAPLYGKNRTETINPVDTDTPNGPFTWKSLGYATGGGTTETRTIEEIGSISRRNIQQLVETKFECSGTIELEYQNARPFYYTLAAYAGSANGGSLQTAPGINHDTVTTGLYRHIIYEPEIKVSTGGTASEMVANAIPDIMSFNFVDGYTAVGNITPKITRKYLGCKVDTLAVNFNRDGAVKLSINWKGAQVYASQSTTAANLLISDFLIYEEVFPPVFGKVYLQEWTLPTSGLPPWTGALDVALAATGNLLGDIPTASLNISNSLEPLFVISDITARAMPSQSRKYEGRMQVAFVSEEMHAKFLGAYNNPYLADPALKGDGVGSVTGSVMTDASQTWATNELAGFFITIAGVSYPIVSNTDTGAITVTGTPSAGACTYTLNKGFGTWLAPWAAADRQK